MCNIVKRTKYCFLKFFSTQNCEFVYLPWVNTLNFRVFTRFTRFLFLIFFFDFFTLLPLYLVHTKTSVHHTIYHYFFVKPGEQVKPKNYKNYFDHDLE